VARPVISPEILNFLRARLLSGGIAIHRRHAELAARAKTDPAAAKTLVLDLLT
jgi:hypothetical protein